MTEATAFQTSCTGYIQALLKATGGKVVATTDDQITQLVASLKGSGQTPSAGCCTAARALLSDVCPRLCLSAKMSRTVPHTDTQVLSHSSALWHVKPNLSLICCGRLSFAFNGTLLVRVAITICPLAMYQWS